MIPHFRSFLASRGFAVSPLLCLPRTHDWLAVLAAWTQSGLGPMTLFSYVNGPDRAAFEDWLAAQTGFPRNQTFLKAPSGQPAPNASAYMVEAFNIQGDYATKLALTGVNFYDAMSVTRRVCMAP